MKEELAKVEKILEYIASRNESHNAVCIPKAQEALAIIRTLNCSQLLLSLRKEMIQYLKKTRIPIGMSPDM